MALSIMPTTIECLPIEIQEKILAMLNGKSLLNASRVCKLWFMLSTRIAKNHCQKRVLPDMVHEVTQDLSCQNEDLWLKIVNYHDLQLLLKENLFTISEPTLHETLQEREANFCYVAYGCYFYVSFVQEIEVYDAQADFKHIMTLTCGNGPIKQIVPVPKLKKILVLSNVLEVFETPVLINDNYEMQKVQIIPKNHECELNKYKAICADNLSLAVQKDEFSISVFTMDFECKDKYFLRFVNRTKTIHKIYQFSLWRDEIIILLEIGEILWWPVASSQVMNCGSYQEIRYRNPVWMVKGRIFCSTLTSRVLLGLWHLEAGTSYWLVGRPTSQLMRCRSLDPVIDGVLHEISSMCLKFRLLICGTSDGTVVVFYLSDSFFNTESVNEKRYLEAEFNRRPEAVMKFSNQAVEDIVADFSEDSLYLLLRSKKNCVNMEFYRLAFDENKLLKEAAQQAAA